MLPWAVCWVRDGVVGIARATPLAPVLPPWCEGRRPDECMPPAAASDAHLRDMDCPEGLGASGALVLVPPFSILLRLTPMVGARRGASGGGDGGKTISRDNDDVEGA